MDSGINRNIVECKVGQLMGALTGKTVLIETLWNVKTVWCILRPGIRIVLIETLWNVKTNIKELIPLCRMVLIETLWNVKVNYADTMKRQLIVLIETLWNVKISRGCIYSAMKQY